jgi:hypothetical protein
MFMSAAQLFFQLGNCNFKPQNRFCKRTRTWSCDLTLDFKVLETTLTTLEESGHASFALSFAVPFKTCTGTASRERPNSSQMD